MGFKAEASFLGLGPGCRVGFWDSRMEVPCLGLRIVVCDSHVLLRHDLNLQIDWVIVKERGKRWLIS